VNGVYCFRCENDRLNLQSPASHFTILSRFVCSPRLCNIDSCDFSTEVFDDFPDWHCRKIFLVVDRNEELDDTLFTASQLTGGWIHFHSEIHIFALINVLLNCSTKSYLCCSLSHGSIVVGFDQQSYHKPYGTTILQPFATYQFRRRKIPLKGIRIESGISQRHAYNARHWDDLMA